MMWKYSESHPDLIHKSNFKLENLFQSSKYAYNFLTKKKDLKMDNNS